MSFATMTDEVTYTDSECKECGGASICAHGRRKSRCKECKE